MAFPIASRALTFGLHFRVSGRNARAVVSAGSFGFLSPTFLGDERGRTRRCAVISPYVRFIISQVEDSVCDNVVVAGYKQHHFEIVSFSGKTGDDVMLPPYPFDRDVVDGQILNDPVLCYDLF